MTSIFFWSKYHFKVTSNLNTWNARILNILEEHDLDGYISIVVEDPTTNEGKIQEKVSMHNSRHYSKRQISWSIYDQTMRNHQKPLKTHFPNALVHLSWAYFENSKPFGRYALVFKDEFFRIFIMVSFKTRRIVWMTEGFVDWILSFSNQFCV